MATSVLDDFDLNSLLGNKMMQQWVKAIFPTVALNVNMQITYAMQSLDGVDASIASIAHNTIDSMLRRHGVNTSIDRRIDVISEESRDTQVFELLQQILISPDWVLSYAEFTSLSDPEKRDFIAATMKSFFLLASGISQSKPAMTLLADMGG